MGGMCTLLEPGLAQCRWGADRLHRVLAAVGCCWGVWPPCRVCYGVRGA